MRRIGFSLAALALLAVLAAGCGGNGGGSGSGDVPSNAVAVVGDDVITKDRFDQLMDQARRGYTQQHRPWPKAGTTEYKQVQQQAIQFLVQRSEFSQEAGDLGVNVTDKDVDARLNQIKKQYFNGNEQKYEKQLKSQGLTQDQVRDDIKAQLVSEAIFKKVTEDVKVTDGDIKRYYDQHKSQYRTPETREVRHILISCQGKAKCAKARTTADRLYRQLRGNNGKNFTQLVKKYSDDPGSKATGGKLTITKGQTVPPFDQTAFLLGAGTISHPVKTTYGYHIIEPLGPVKPAKTTPLSQVKAAIKSQLEQQKKNEKMNAWIDDLKKKYDVKYQRGFEPPTTTTSKTR